MMIAIAWLNLENMMLNKINQTQRTTHSMVPLIGDFIEPENRLVVA